MFQETCRADEESSRPLFLKYKMRERPMKRPTRLLYSYTPFVANSMLRVCYRLESQGEGPGLSGLVLQGGLDKQSDPMWAVSCSFSKTLLFSKTFRLSVPRIQRH